MKLLIASVAFVALVTPAAAEPARPAGEPDISQVKVAYSDLDLARSAGADAMIARLRQAAWQVCGPTPSPRELRKMARYRACSRAALEAAVTGVNAPLVTVRFYGSEPRRTLAAR